MTFLHSHGLCLEFMFWVWFFISTQVTWLRTVFQNPVETHKKDYSLLPLLAAAPQVGEKIAFKVYLILFIHLVFFCCCCWRDTEKREFPSANLLPRCLQHGWTRPELGTWTSAHVSELGGGNPVPKLAPLAPGVFVGRKLESRAIVRLQSRYSGREHDFLNGVLTVKIKSPFLWYVLKQQELQQKWLTAFPNKLVGSPEMVFVRSLLPEPPTVTDW